MDSDKGSENSFKVDSYKVMPAKNKRLIMVVNRNVVVRRTKNNFEIRGNELKASYIMCSSLEELSVLSTKTKILDVALNFSMSYTRYAPERGSGFTIESSPSIPQVIKAFAFAFEEMLSEEIETALTDGQDGNGSSAEQTESIGENLSLSGLFPSRSKIMNNLRNRCIYLSEEEYCMLNILDAILKRGERG